mmetsp:Transcript_79671/g.165513  ORF Transcript_79671/g.165513 Transcript_79671/m.165513 type:complete len:382 (-) Transcript_79671:40-1185(-)
MERAAKRPRGGEPPAEADILHLVSQREAHRQAKRYAESDAIREELRSMGVELYDKEKEWRSVDGRRGSLIGAAVGGECYLTDVEIQDLISRREEARRTKDWATADTIRDELRSHGVELEDKQGFWRTSGGRSGSYVGGPVPVRKPFSEASLAIRTLVAERERHRATNNFEAADEVRRQLAQMGVELFDSERIWKSVDGQQGVMVTGGHQVDCLLTDHEIQSRITQREDARMAKDFSRADLLREDLRRNGVELVDGQKFWVSTDGRQGFYRGSMPPAALGAMPAGRSSSLATTLAPPVMPMMQPVGVMAGGMAVGNMVGSTGTMSLSTVSIMALVQGRERAREGKDWQAADAIREDLRAHGVDVWDKDKNWRCSDGRHGRIP